MRLQIDAPDSGLRIDLQRAIPCGLLVTELVTNAIKHAFPNAAGSIAVRVELNAEGQVCVDVLDDGIGLPLGTASGGRGLGFQLLPVLAEQCRARLEQLAVEQGTRFRLLVDMSDGEPNAGHS